MFWFGKTNHDTKSIYMTQGTETRAFLGILYNNHPPVQMELTFKFASGKGLPEFLICTSTTEVKSTA